MLRKKTLWIVVILGVFILAGAGVWFYWHQYVRETPPEEWDSAKTSAPKDYVVKETARGRVVENKKAGLRFEVPTGWRVEKPEVEGIRFIKLWSPSAIELNTALMKKGCRMNVNVTVIKTNLETLKKETTENIGAVMKNMTTTTVGGKRGIEYRIQSRSNNLHHKEAMILGESRLYTFTIDAAPQDEETCFSTFDQFLKTVSITG